MYRNYYTYLYGLPMKLKDLGRIISPRVLEKKNKWFKLLGIKSQL